MERLAIIQSKKLLKQRFGFSGKEKRETMDSLAIIQGRKIVKTTIGFSS